MISAREALFQSRNMVTINEILASVETSINTAIHNGQTSAHTSMSQDVSKEVRDRVMETLEKLGYTVIMSNNKEQYKNAPADQSPWYDDIFVEWGN